MLATVINSLALQNIWKMSVIMTREMTALEVRSIAEPYIRRRAKHGNLEKNRVIVFAGGTGNPYSSPLIRRPP
jgi:uridylate kinase